MKAPHFFFQEVVDSRICLSGPRTASQRTGIESVLNKERSQDEGQTWLVLQTTANPAGDSPTQGMGRVGLQSSCEPVLTGEWRFEASKCNVPSKALLIKD